MAKLLNFCSINNLFSIFSTFFLLSPVWICSSNDKIAENFNTFSEALEEKFAESPDVAETRPGVHLLNSFGVGYILANLHQGLWNISAVGVPEALKTMEKYIPDDYGHLLRLFKKNKFQMTSTIYSRFGNVTGKSSSFPMLMTHLITTDYIANPAKFVDSFSSLMESGTKGQLENELLPKGLWLSVFDNNTQGAYINTMYFKAKHAIPWTKVGLKAFNSDSTVTFLQVEGDFPLFVNDNVTVVIVDIQQMPPKQLILAKHHFPMTIPQLKKQVGEILEASVKASVSTSPSSSFTLTKLRVQIPAVSVTNLARHHLGLTLMGVEETFCNGNGTTSIPEFVQQPITQANHFEFAEDYLEFSSATGSIVTLNTGDLDVNLDEEYDDDDIDSILVNDDDEDENDFTGSLFRAALKFDPNSHRTKTAVTSALLKRLKLQPPTSPGSYSASPLKYELQAQRGKRNLNRVMKVKSKGGRQKAKEPVRQSTKHCKNVDEIFRDNQIKGGTTTEDKFGGENETTKTLIFDSPFAFMLRDEKLGETFSGYVESICDYNTVMNSLQTSSIHAWLHDVFKVAFWKCY